MKILEIIQEYDATDQRIRYRKPNYDYTSLKRAKNRKDPNYDPDLDSAPDSERPSRQLDKSVKGGDGPGWYSGGQTNPRDPHEFVKKPHLTTLMDEDAYYTYIMKIRDLKQQEGYHNPFFPQVYNIDITQDSKGNQRPRYRIEKLQKGEDFSFEALLGLYERLFNDEFDQRNLETSNKSYAVWREIARQVNRAVEQSNYTNIKNDQLEEALRLISKIIDEHSHWNVDLHLNNIRVRGSSTGPQLVLMDPISDGGYSIPDPKDIMYGPKLRSKLTPPPPPKS